MDSGMMNLNSKACRVRVFVRLGKVVVLHVCLTKL